MLLWSPFLSRSQFHQFKQPHSYHRDLCCGSLYDYASCISSSSSNGPGQYFSPTLRLTGSDDKNSISRFRGGHLVLEGQTEHWPPDPKHSNQLSKENMTTSDRSRPLAMGTRLRNSFLSATLKIKVWAAKGQLKEKVHLRGKPMSRGIQDQTERVIWLWLYQ